MKKLSAILLSASAALISALPVWAAETAHDVAVAEGAAHGAEHGGGGGGLPQFDPTSYPSQLFWLAVTFVVLYTFFSKKTLPEISRVLENRHEHIRGDMDTADRLRAEAEAAQLAYDSLLQGARTKSSQMMNAATEQVKGAADAHAAEFRTRSAAAIEATEARLQAEKTKLMGDMNQIAAEVASEAAAKILGVKADLSQAKTVVQALNAREAA